MDFVLTNGPVAGPARFSYAVLRQTTACL